MSTKYLLIGLFILMLIGLPAVVSADATNIYVDDNPAGGWDTTDIISPGTYYLMNDVYGFDGGGPVIRILADDVILEGNGHVLEGAVTPHVNPCVNRATPHTEGIIVGPAVSDHIIIKNLTVRQFTSGIYYNGVDQGIIQDISVSECDNGIRLLNSDGIDISGIIADSNFAYDIRSESGNDNVIHNNTITDNLDTKQWPTINEVYGIYVASDTGSVVRDNQIEDTTPTAYLPPNCIPCGGTIEHNIQGYGIYYNGDSGTIQGNDISNCQNGIYIYETDDSTIDSNTIHDNTDTSAYCPLFPYYTFYRDISLWRSSRNHVEDNTIEGNAIPYVDFNKNGEDGIMLYRSAGVSCADNVVKGNNVSDIYTGIGLVGCGQVLADGGNTIDQNTLEDNEYGIWLMPDGTVNSNYNTISDNTVTGSTTNGIRLEGVSILNPNRGNTISGNEVTQNNEGIFFRRAYQNTIDSNQVNQNVQGIHIWETTATTILDNTIIGNSGSGIHLEESNLNTIYNNCFNNTYNTAFDPVIPGANNWNTLMSPGPNIVGGKYFGGNYWADPLGTGFSQVNNHNADEFINTAYPLAAGNNDNFPLWDPLQASFDTNPSTPDGNVPFTVDFTDTSLGNPTCWHWDFGDGGSSSLQSPSHTYTADETYHVTLTVSRCPVADCAGTSSADVTVHVGPQADFTATPTVGPAPLMVTFTNMSTVNGTTYHWDFGDSGTSNDRNTVHQYLNPGLYTVSLTVTGTFGTDTETKTNYIDVRTPLVPVADFTASPLVGDRPLTVQFTDLSTNSPTGWSWAYEWSGGGGWVAFDTPSVQNPIQVFSSPGTYTIRLTATNTGGSGAPVTKTDYITVNGPLADFTASPRTGITPLTVYFTDLSTNNPSTYKWEYNDGSGWVQFSTDPNPSHDFTTGTYQIRLTVDSSSIWANTKTSPASYITVSQIPAPEAYFTASPFSGVKPLTVVFTDLSTGNPTSWSWNFGDGGTSTTQNPTYTYTNHGTFTVTLTVSNDGGTNSYQRTITVANIPAPVVDFTASPRTGTTPLTVNFDDLSINNPTSWSWNFGDGGSSTIQRPSHTYSSIGTYNVTLTATNDGGTGTLKKDYYITVSNIPAPTAEFAASPSSGTIPLTVNFIDQSTGNPTTWRWDFGDGYSALNTKNPNHTYTNPGTFLVTLNVSNNGGYNVQTHTIQVNDIPLPSANFVANPLSGITPVTVQFTDSSGGNPTSWYWEFGDGSTSTLQSPTHTYSSPRKYTVRLTVSNVKGQNSIQKPDYIWVKNIPPTADFTGSPTTGNEPLTVHFTDQSLGLGINTWQWTFGDGGTSTTQSPAYIYNTNGTYNVTLTVSNDGGSSTKTRNAYIVVNPAPPVPPANVIELYPGWNFVSVPKKLASGDDTAIEVFGGVDLGGHAALTYDAATGMWKQVTASTVLKPLDGYWIYSVTRMDVELTFDTSSLPSPVSKQLYTGYNAIGYAGNNSMSARDFLTLSGGLDGNWAVLLGYHNGMNADDPIIRDSSDPRYSDNRPVYPTHGYWILMNANDVLQVVV